MRNLECCHDCGNGCKTTFAVNSDDLMVITTTVAVTSKTFTIPMLFSFLSPANLSSSSPHFMNIVVRVNNAVHS